MGDGWINIITYYEIKMIQNVFIDINNLLTTVFVLEIYLLHVLSDRGIVWSDRDCMVGMDY